MDYEEAILIKQESEADDCSRCEFRRADGCAAYDAGFTCVCLEVTDGAPMFIDGVFQYRG